VKNAALAAPVAAVVMFASAASAALATLPLLQRRAAIAARNAAPAAHRVGVGRLACAASVARPSGSPISPRRCRTRLLCFPAP